MAHAYTPGLKVTEGMTIQKERRLPLQGEVLVEAGAAVQAEDVVAKADLPGNVQLLNVANLLSVPAEEITEYMLKLVGETIAKDEIIATTKGLFGLFKSQARSPIDGTIEAVSDVTGQVILREPPIPVEVKAYTDGTVTEISPNEGVTVETYGTYIQGIFGVGSETIGNLIVAVSSPSDGLTAEQILPEHRDHILVGGSLVTTEAIQKAIQQGVKGIIAGGIDDADLRELLGYELGVAITGSEEIGITLVITEGFGSVAMAEQTFDLLKTREGMKTSINGATQIRAGVVRPEIVIPLVSDAGETRAEKDGSVEGILEVGSSVRIIREPYFGKLGRVTELPVELQNLETEAQVRVLRVELEDGEQTLLPRANVETIEGG
ncbi:hypothetical protein F4X88_11230 [Candidatus Poribacteria bacterium]|nr:hypothetical protein [Candidatus Poribacteria bacterium]MYA56861.1 hypothetical protein [Candidatus Poribacteria bacterium]